MKEEIYKGLSASKGIVLGNPYIYLSSTPIIKLEDSAEINIDNEIHNYFNAVDKVKKELKKIYKLARNKLDDTNLLIFEAQILFLDDNVLHDSVVERIKTEKRNVADIFIEEIRKIENKLFESNDEHIRERIADIEEIKNRVLRRLVKDKLFSKIDLNSIVVARNLTPSDTILFSHRNLLGFATDLGGTTSHVAIIARSLNVPAVVGLHDMSIHIEPTDYLIIDGYKGEVVRNPSQATVEKYLKQIKKIQSIEKDLIEIEHLPSETMDGKSVKLSVNLEFNKEIDYIVSHTKCEVGLYRTEHLFFEKGDFPSFNEQYRQYKMLAERIFPNKVTIRTFDVGGDKLLPDSQKEHNPFLGWRGIRICLDKKDMFFAQLKAILRASWKGNLKIMLPMISSLEEVRESKEVLESAKDDLRKRKIQFDNNIEFGIMIEVPSAVFIADSLAKEVDFFSIGTNDLIQYTLAVDRGSNIVADLYQKFHPAVIIAIKQIINSAKKNKISVSVCGEMGGDPLGALLLIGMGIDELSVDSTSFLNLKKLIRVLNFQQVQKLANEILNFDTEVKIRESLMQYYNQFKLN